MKLETQYKDLNMAIEFTPEEVGKFMPFFIRSLFNKKITIIKTYSLLEQMMVDCQKKYGWKNFTFNKPYFKETRVCLLIEQMPFFIKNGVKDRFIDEYTIDNYEQSDIFFAVMEIFFNKLKKKDITKIFERFIDNDQASPYSFLESVEKEKPQLLIPKIINHLRAEQLKWEAENN